MTTNRVPALCVSSAIDIVLDHVLVSRLGPVVAACGTFFFFLCRMHLTTLAAIRAHCMPWLGWFSPARTQPASVEK